MAADIQQCSGGHHPRLYDPSETIKAMQMCWTGFEQYNNYHHSPASNAFMPAKIEPQQPNLHHQQQQQLASFVSSMTSSFPFSRPISGPPTPNKKRPNPVPEEQKDENYRERRRRNNESARRSREIRRSKEEQTLRRVELLQAENTQLRAELTMLRGECEHLRQVLHQVMHNNNNSNT